ncbi:potassium channel family protein [Paracoccus lutimaris]|uniref:Ion channel n=1 Tax=Paracoccus lutimaris TaxID=1490030 RepID=A0A368Z2H4_9RHOB|nr:potassium channel family protein [Paracoccus lutimaris]RCW86652.1 ion channel [Paracoccus lutimaris]
MHAFIELGLGLRAAFTSARVRLLLLLTATLIGLASTAFHHVEGWRWLDSIYFSVITIATIGYGDIVPKTDPGKIITIVYVLCGLGLFVATATAIADAIISHANDHLDALAKAEEIERRIRKEL